MATQLTAVTPADPRPQQVSIVQKVANRYGMAAARFVRALYETCVPANATESQVAAFLSVADEYGLNPLTKEIYAFESKGRVVPMISIDGWVSMVNRHPMMDGMEFTDVADADGKLLGIECTMFRKDRTRPIKVIEYLSECKGTSGPWTKSPARMLRHRALIQCARYAFGFSGVASEDEADAIMGGDLHPMRDATPPRRAIEGDEDAKPFYPPTGQIEARSERTDGEGEAIDAETGEVTAAGEPLPEIKAEPAKRQRAAKPADPVTLPGEAEDDLAGKIEASIMAAATIINVADIVMALPSELSTEAVAYLSGVAEKRKAEIRAAALKAQA